MTNEFYLLTITKTALDTIYDANKVLLTGNKDSQMWKNDGTQVFIKVVSGYTGSLSGVAVAKSTLAQIQTLKDGVDWNLDADIV